MKTGRFGLLCAAGACVAAGVWTARADAPRFTVTRVRGVLRLTVDGVPQAGMCALPDFGKPPEEIAFSMGDFAAAGVRVFSDLCRRARGGSRRTTGGWRKAGTTGARSTGAWRRRSRSRRTAGSSRASSATRRSGSRANTRR